VKITRAMNKLRSGGNNENHHQYDSPLPTTTNEDSNRSSYSSGGSSSSSIGSGGGDEEDGMEVKRSVKSIVQGITRKLSSHQLTRTSSWTKNLEVISYDDDDGYDDDDDDDDDYDDGVMIMMMMMMMMAFMMINGKSFSSLSISSHLFLFHPPHCHHHLFSVIVTGY